MTEQNESGQDRPVASGRTETDWTPKGAKQTSEVKQLQEDIEQTREDLGETVGALAAKLDVKARARQRAQAVRAKAGDLTEQARKTAADPEKSAKFKQGGAALAGTGAVVALIWVMRRRRARPMTRWEKARFRAADLGSLAVARANELMASDTAILAKARIQQAAYAPEAKPRAQGAGATVATLLTLMILRRAARRMPSGR